MKLFKLVIGVFVSMMSRSTILWVDDPKTAGKEPEPAKAEPETPEVDIDAMIEKAKEDARAEALKEAEGKYKKEISTRDQAITKLQKAVNETKSEEEKKQIEAEQEKRELLEEFANIAGASLGLDEKHSPLLKGNNKNEIKETAEMLKSFKQSVEEPLVKELKAKDEIIKSLDDEIKILKASKPAPPDGKSTTETKLTLEEIEKLPTHEERIKALKENGYRQ